MVLLAPYLSPSQPMLNAQVTLYIQQRDGLIIRNLFYKKSDRNALGKICIWRERTQTYWGRTDGMVIVQHGEIIYKLWSRFYTKNPHLMWSVAKSVNSALIGRAVQEGYMTIDDGICEHYADVDSGNCDIQVVDLLRFLWFGF